MSPLDARIAQLVAEIERDWEQVRKHFEKARSVDAGRGDAEAALVALSLDHAYQAFETLLLRIERALGLPDRTGTSWHATLLLDAGSPLRPLRPAVYPMSVHDEWDSLMRFRHFLRHAYAVRLDVERLHANVFRLDRAVAATDPHVRALLEALSVVG